MVEEPGVWLYTDGWFGPESLEGSGVSNPVLTNRSGCERGVWAYMKYHEVPGIFRMTFVASFDSSAEIDLLPCDVQDVLSRNREKIEHTLQEGRKTHGEHTQT